MGSIRSLLDSFILSSLLFASSAAAQEKSAEEEAPLTEAEPEMGSEPAEAKPEIFSIPIVYTGGSRGIGSGTYQFKLPAAIDKALGDEGEIQNIRAYHGVLAQGPYRLIAQQYSFEPDGSKRKHYYVNESCGIAAGMFIAALHNMGLATLTHTPSPMAFLSRILERPKGEKPYILFPIGFPTADCVVPDLSRKALGEVSVFL